jgi:crotonobetainyl-CoA hydratase
VGRVEAEHRPVVTEKREHVLVITISRPASRNALNQTASSLIGAALEEADANPDIRTVIISGVGDQAFCAGADLKALGRGEPLLTAGHAEWGFGGFVRHPISKPVIAAVNGICLGAGIEIALASDIIVAVESASFGLPEVKRGIMAAAGGIFRLGTVLPRKIALETIFAGRSVNAADADHLGLVNRVVHPGEAPSNAMELATLIGANARLAVQASKRIALGIEGGRIPAEDPAWRLNNAEYDAALTSNDAREGISAFNEKRTPVWTAT